MAVFDFDFLYYLRNAQISFLIMNMFAGLYFVLVRSVSWSSIGEASTMERQGKYLLLFCLAISFINIIEISQSNTILGWSIFMAIQFLTGAVLGLIVDRYIRI